MADPIARAIGTFSALKGMDLRQQAFDQEQEDRAFNRGMAMRAENRTQEAFDMNKAAQESNAAWQQKERGRKVQDWTEADIEKARSQADQILLQAVKGAEASGTDLDVSSLLAQLEPVKHGLKRKLQALYDPQTVQARTDATLGLLKQLRSGQFDHDTLLQDANLAFADELDARGRKYDAKQVRFARLAPSPQGDGFMAEAEITRTDGSTYRAPLTENAATAQDGDNAVKNFRMEEVIPYLVGKLQTLQGAKAYLEARGLIEEPEQKWKFGADGELMLDEKSGTVKKTGYVKPDKDGKGGGKGKGLTAENYKLFDDQLNKQFLAEFQAAPPAEQKKMADLMESDALGNQRVSMERVVAKMPKEMRDRYNAARQAGEHFMADGSLTPILAANKAYTYASQKGGGGQTEENYSSVDAKDKAAVQEVAKYLATLPVEAYDAEVKEMRRENPSLVEALVVQRRGSRKSPAVADVRTRGMAPAASPVDVQSQIFPGPATADRPAAKGMKDYAVDPATGFPARTITYGFGDWSPKVSEEESMRKVWKTNISNIETALRTQKFTAQKRAELEEKLAESRRQLEKLS